MRYLAIDLETTGLDPSRCGIFQIGAVVAEFSSPDPVAVWQCELDPFDGPAGSGGCSMEPYALMMNARFIERIAKAKEPYLHCSAQRVGLGAFLAKWFPEGKITVAGKNVASFDVPFLRANGFGEVTKRFHHRSIDCGNLFLLPSDLVLPDLALCMARAQVQGEVTHDAVDDAKDVVKVVHAWWRLSQAVGQ